MKYFGWLYNENYLQLWFFWFIIVPRPSPPFRNTFSSHVLLDLKKNKFTRFWWGFDGFCYKVSIVFSNSICNTIFFFSFSFFFFRIWLNVDVKRRKRRQSMFLIWNKPRNTLLFLLLTRFSWFLSNCHSSRWYFVQNLWNTLSKPQIFVGNTHFL